jgi:hypothetical protein
LCVHLPGSGGQQFPCIVSADGSGAGATGRPSAFAHRAADGRWIWCLPPETVFARDPDGSVRVACLHEKKK